MKITKALLTAAVLGAAFFTISGCALVEMQKNRGPVWNKPGASQQDWDQDFGQCNAQAFSVASGNLMQIAIVQHGCLQGKGWRKE